jgi:hypothetical protein
MNPTNKRPASNGLFRYPAIAVRNGAQLIATEFADWFADDAAAEAGFREILTAQGYTVKAIRIGNITEIEIS